MFRMLLFFFVHISPLSLSLLVSIAHEMKLPKYGAGFTPEQFREFCRNHHNLLFPVFMLQRKLQKKAVGESFWETQSRKRVRLSRGRYVSTHELLEMFCEFSIELLVYH
jgi:hypothetical protein